MRPIDADRLLEERRIQKYYHLPNGDIAIPIIDIEHAPTVELDKGWIPVSERLPKNGTSVLFCDDEGDIYNGYCLVRDGGRYHNWMEYHNADRIKNVVAWMYWPDPYKGEEE